MDLRIVGVESMPEPVTSSGPADEHCEIQVCPLCNSMFSSPAFMRNHLEEVHKKYQCEVCLKLMSHKRNVDRHRRSVHENERGFGCPMCPYRSAHKQVVKRHLVTKHSCKRQQSLPIISVPTMDNDMVSTSEANSHDPIFYANPQYYSFSPPWLSQSETDKLQQQQHVGQIVDECSVKKTVEADENNNNVVDRMEELMAEANLTDGRQTNNGVSHNNSLMTATISLCENHVRIFFQRGPNVHLVQVPFPDI